MFAGTILAYSIFVLGALSLPQGHQGNPGHSRQPGRPHQGHSSGPGQNGGAQSPSYSWLFQYPLPVPPIAQPSYEEKVNERTIQYFELTIEAFEQQIYPNLGPAHLIGYNGSAPGPTFHLDKGVESVVRLLNKGSEPAAMHLHGSPSHAPWDGWAGDLVQPGEYKDYYYPNFQAGPLWYHDHVDGSTAPHTYFGQHGIYIIHDPKEDVLALPTGNYDIPLGFIDKTYQSNGDLASPTGSNLNFFGDIIHVNGQPWPYLNVEPRKYRLRFYDMSLSRSYDLSFVDESNNSIEFSVIASEGGLFEYPVSSEDIVMAMGERYEVIMDFSAYKGSNITLMNTLDEDLDPQYVNTNMVMRFVVGDTVSDSSNNGPLPSQLKNVNWPAAKSGIDRVYNFQHGGDDLWTINGVSFSDINNRVLARLPQGSVEVWQLNYASGPGIHPVHIHLVNFQVVSRTGGSRGLLPYEAAGLKDVVLLEPGESVVVRAFYGPWNGLYMFHCHNLIHEDSLMMDAFNVTQLEELGYEFESTFKFQDPTDPKYVAKTYNAAAYEPSAIKKAIRAFGRLDAYAPAVALSKSEGAYYATAGYPTPSVAVNTAQPTGAQPTGAQPTGAQPTRTRSSGAQPTGHNGQPGRHGPPGQHGPPNGGQHRRAMPAPTQA